jgi:hypothetical protein
MLWGNYWKQLTKIDKILPLSVQIAFIHFLSTQTFRNLKKSKFYKYHTYMIYTIKGMLLATLIKLRHVWRNSVC